MKQSSAIKKLSAKIKVATEKLKEMRAELVILKDKEKAKASNFVEKVKKTITKKKTAKKYKK